MSVMGLCRSLTKGLKEVKEQKGNLSKKPEKRIR